jgi:hypothetical protein
MNSNNGDYQRLCDWWSHCRAEMDGAVLYEGLDLFIIPENVSKEQ